MSVLSIPCGNGCRYLSPGAEATSLPTKEKKEEVEGCLEAGESAKVLQLSVVDFSMDHPPLFYPPNSWAEQLTFPAKLFTSSNFICAYSPNVE